MSKILNLEIDVMRKLKNEIVKCNLYKVITGIMYNNFYIEAYSESQAINLAYDLHKRNGLIGRYYLETSNGNIYQINPK